MADREITYSQALAEVERLLTTPPTAPLSNPPQQIGDSQCPTIALSRLREAAGTPDHLLVLASEIIWASRESKGFLSEPEIGKVLALIAFHREWEQREAWRPTPLEIRRPTEVQGRRVTFTRATARQPKVWDLSWWRGRRA